MSDQIVLVFTPERETKNTVRYQEDAHDGTVGNPGEPAIGTLYVQRRTIERLGLTTTDRLTVTLSKSE